MTKKKRTSKKKQYGGFIPGNAFSCADQDYYNKLTPEEREKWITQFNSEYYSNDHSKEGSLFRSIEGYDTEKRDEFRGDFKQGYKPLTLKQALNKMTNDRNSDILSNASHKKQTVSYEDVAQSLDNPVEEKIMTLADRIDELLPVISPRDILEQFKKEAKIELQEDESVDDTLQWLTQAAMLLAIKASSSTNKKKS